MGELRIVVAGAGGRMGRNVIRAIAESEHFTLAAALVRSGGAQVGKKASLVSDNSGSAIVTNDPALAIASADAIVDFSAPESSIALAAIAARKHVHHVIGTTGFSAEQEQQIEAAARETVVVKSANMSVGVALLANLVEQAASALPDFDIEILEMHHRMKVDTPSGTALLLGRAAARGRKVTLQSEERRHGDREKDTVSVVSLRGGTVVGEHQVIFAGPHERVALSHTAEDRMIFARGALLAVQWAQGKPPGLYSMNDVAELSG
jgi:4-hydroxy-tetrahydrodipicolinate reductase